jgi:hypothetical protein
MWRRVRGVVGAQDALALGLVFLYHVLGDIVLAL